MDKLPIAIQLLHRLSAAERRRLDRRLQPGKGERPTTVYRVYTYLRKKRTATPVDYRTLLQRCAPELRSDNRSANRLYDELRKAIEAFLVDEALRRDKQLYLQILQRELAGRQVRERFERVSQELLSSLEAAPTSSEGLVHQFTAYTTWFSQQSLHRLPNFAEALDTQARHLDTLFLFGRTKIEIELLNRQRLYKDTQYASVPLLSAALANQLTDAEISFPVRFLLLVQRWVAAPTDEALFAAVTQAYPTYLNAVSASEKYFLIVLLQNQYNQLLINRRDERYLRAGFELNRYRIQTAPDEAPAEVGLVAFVNMVNSGIFLRETVWVNEFVARYLPRLPETVRTFASAIVAAYLSLDGGDSRTAFYRLRTVRIDQPLLTYLQKFIECRLVYRMALSERDPTPLKQYIRAFRSWLRDEPRRTLPAERIQGMLNALTLLLHCYQYAIAPSLAGHQLLIDRYEHTAPLKAALWFKREIERLGS